MSQKDLQFIDRALERPWMFWVYFWKWPRIIRQACAEYDLLAKERDAAKDAHEQALRANKIVQDWIYTTHKLDMTADLRAIWTAGKRLSVLLLFLSVAMPVKAQLPPILRQYFTTNAHVLSHGAGSLTNNGTGTLGWFNGFADVSDLLWTNNGTYTHLIISTNIVQFYPLRTVFGFPDDGDEENFNTVTITNGGIGALDHAFETDPADNPGSIALARNGGVAAASYFLSTNCTIRGSEGGVGGGYMDSSVACRSEGSDGSWGGISATLSTNVSVKGSSGSFAGGYSREGTNITVLGLNASALFGYHDRSSEAKTTVFKSGMAVSYMEQAHYNTNTADRSIQIASFVGARTNTLSSIRTISAISFFGTNGQAAGVDSLVVGLVGSNERMYAGDASGVGAVASSAIGRDLAGTNNWTFGIHYTNTVPFSLAVGANGTTQFRAASNSVVIRTETAPTVGQILTATDTSGTVGWSNAPASGIATNNGTGWNTTFFGQTNFGSVTFTNGMRIDQPAANVLTITNGQLQLWSGATNRVALYVTNAADTHTFTNLAMFWAPPMSNGSVVTIRGTWQNDTINFPAAFLIDMKQTASGSLTPLAQFNVDGSSVHSFKRSGVYDMAGNATVANSGGALTLIHANGDDVRVKSSGATPVLGFYDSSTVFQGSIARSALGALTLKTNLTVANVTTSASYASSATNRIAITATGYTNTMTVLGIAVDVDVYFDAATATLSDPAGNTMHTFQAGTNITVHLKPSWRLAGTTMAGTAIAH